MKRFRSLSKSLTYRIMAVVLVMIAVITGIIYFYVKDYMVNEAQERYERVLQRDHEEFRRRLSDVMVAVKNNLDDIENEIDQPEKLMHRLERILQVNPTIITSRAISLTGNNASNSLPLTTLQGQCALAASKKTTTNI